MLIEFQSGHIPRNASSWNIRNIFWRIILSTMILLLYQISKRWSTKDIPGNKVSLDVSIIIFSRIILSTMSSFALKNKKEIHMGKHSFKIKKYIQLDIHQTFRMCSENIPDIHQSFTIFWHNIPQKNGPVSHRNYTFLFTLMLMKCQIITVNAEWISLRLESTIIHH